MLGIHFTPLTMPSSRQKTAATQPLLSLDLFTGIGGIAHGLRNIVRPVAFCEIDPSCQAVLRKLMANGTLPHVPIFPDVRQLPKQQGGYFARVDLVTAGFPCQGFSTAGKMRGLDHTQSSLFRHLLKVLDVCVPEFVFLENVASIISLRSDFISILRSLLSRGYALRWTVMGARDVGALHKRNRWFCLCHRVGGANGSGAKNSSDATTVVGGRRLVLPPFKRFKWDRRSEPKPRMESVGKGQLRYPADYNNAWSMLGNSVCPDCVRMAFLFLWSGGIVRHLPTTETVVHFDMHDIIRTCFQHSTDATTVTAAMPQWKYAYIHPHSQGVFGMPSAPAVDMKHLGKTSCPNIILDWRIYKKGLYIENKRKTSSEMVKTRIILKSWYTPRAIMGSSSNMLSMRNQYDLPTQVRFAVDTTGDRAGRVNIRWLEWLMGYPAHWTGLK